MSRIRLSTKNFHSDSAIDFEKGGRLATFDVAYETWGDPAADDVIVVVHALSGSSHCFASDEDPEPGWWDQLGAGDAPFSPRRAHVICANLIGGCYGTTGPASVDPATGRPYLLGFPQITIADMVDVWRRLLVYLGIDRPITVVGGSMGGMIALRWAIDHPDEVRDVVIICAPARSYPQAIALRSVQRDALLNDPNFRRGAYTPDAFPAQGLALARKIGMITYRSDREFTERFGRAEKDARPHFTEGSFEIQSYLDHQGRKFVARFDPNTYLYYSRAMDLYDLSAGHASLAGAVSRVRARALFVAMSSDWLCPPYHVEETHAALRSAGHDSTYVELETSHGHDGFLIETPRINEAIRRFRAR